MKKFNLLFILVLSVFLVFSCSSNDDEKEELTDDNNVLQDEDNTGDTLPDASENDDDKTDTSSDENDDSDTLDPIRDSDTSDTGITDNDISDNDDDPDTTSDSSDFQSDEDAADSGDSEPDEDTSDSTDDPDTEPDDDQEIVISEIPVVFGNICTGQTKCYNETSEITCPDEGKTFFGQDAQYAKKGECIPQKFTVKGSGNEKIVFDENLKLEWQQKITKNVDWQHASEECAKEYAGSYGWRLPTPKELLSIVNSGKFDPSVDTDYFPGTTDEWFWTSADFASTESYDSGKAWFVRFDSGFLSHKKKTESEKMHVRCVRGTTLPDGEFETQTIGGDEVVKDSVTGLMWQKRELKDNTDEIGSFEAALSYCEKLTYAGFSDWRLPNKNELTTLADYGKYHPASAFPGMINRSFRTSTSNAKKSPTSDDWKNAWYVTFYEGVVNFEGKSTADFVRCVRR